VEQLERQSHSLVRHTFAVLLRRISVCDAKVASDDCLPEQHVLTERGSASDPVEVCLAKNNSDRGPARDAEAIGVIDSALEEVDMVAFSSYFGAGQSH
jgi:hypothetical protein